MKLILPKDLVPVEPEDVVFFLAGPIKGGGDWQQQAACLIYNAMPEAYIACPTRYQPDHPLYRFRLPAAIIAISHQTIWERHYLALASKQGCIVFWLPEEDPLNPRPAGSGPYARDTYGELGEWRARIFFENARVVIGAQVSFPGLLVVQRNFQIMIGNFHIHETLEATIQAAVAMAKMPTGYRPPA